MTSKIVTIGGGGGHSQTLKGLRPLRDLTITAICPNTDSGGSTGILAEEYRAPKFLGDLTQCITALCPNQVRAKKLLHRYKRGFLEGHSRKNLIFFHLWEVFGLEQALSLMGKLCGIGDDRVIPVSNVRSVLCATLKGGNVAIEETNIDNLAQNPLWDPEFHKIQGIHLNPEVQASQSALDAIMSARWVVLCPGDLFSSVLPVLLPVGMIEVLQKTSAKIIFLPNIMTKKGETQDYFGEHFIARVEEMMGRQCDIIVANVKDIPDPARKKYQLEQKERVMFHCGNLEGRLIPARFLAVNKKGQVVHNPRVITDVFERILSR